LVEKVMILLPVAERARVPAFVTDGVVTDVPNVPVVPVNAVVPAVPIVPNPVMVFPLPFAVIFPIEEMLLFPPVMVPPRVNALI
jgi:hypothetical protein